MVTVATRYNLDEAFLIRSHLEGSGIPAFIPDEFLAQNDWAGINAIGGIRIQVPDEHEEAALELIYDSQKSAPDTNSPLECPHCHSPSLFQTDLSRKIALCFLVLLTVPLPFFRARYQCRSCGKKFKTA